METFEKKIKDILLELFAEDELQLETEPDGRVSGFIISDKFVDMDHLARQRKVWSLLRKKLSKTEQMKILGFVAFTPAEHEAYSEPSLD
jgi:acid stress-induced BolA-like protein IbaG/YrbA